LTWAVAAYAAENSAATNNAIFFMKIGSKGLIVSPAEVLGGTQVYQIRRLDGE
jgi:hypothetical protein